MASESDSRVCILTQGRCAVMGAHDSSFNKRLPISTIRSVQDWTKPVAEIPQPAGSPPCPGRTIPHSLHNPLRSNYIAVSVFVVSDSGSRAMTKEHFLQIKLILDRLDFWCTLGWGKQ
jgi:hypothetical protein